MKVIILLIIFCIIGSLILRYFLRPKKPISIYKSYKDTDNINTNYCGNCIHDYESLNSKFCYQCLDSAEKINFSPKHKRRAKKDA